MPSFTEILDELVDEPPDDNGTIKFGDVVVRFEDRGFGPLLLAPALIAILPTGAIPGIPAICALFIILISSQIIFGRNHPWLPSRLKNISISRDKLEKSIGKARPFARKIDRILKRRLEIFTRDIATRIVGMIAITLSLIMIPLEAIPFACAIPGGSLAFLALGLSTRDGLTILIGLATTAFSVWALLNWWPF